MNRRQQRIKALEARRMGSPGNSGMAAFNELRAYLQATDEGRQPELQILTTDEARTLADEFAALYPPEAGR